MPAAKNAPTKRVSKPRKKADKVFYVVSKRARLFGWTPVQVFPTYVLAAEYKELYETFSTYGVNGYKIDKVVLIKNKPEANEIVSIP